MLSGVKDAAWGLVVLLLLASRKQEIWRGDIVRLQEKGGPFEDRKISKRKHATFEHAALSVQELNAPAWRNKRHADQWLSSLQLHVFPFIDARQVSEITAADILKVLSPICVEIADTAKKIRQRLRLVIK